MHVRAKNDIKRALAIYPLLRTFALNPPRPLRAKTQSPPLSPQTTLTPEGLPAMKTSSATKRFPSSADPWAGVWGVISPAKG